MADAANAAATDRLAYFAALAVLCGLRVLPYGVSIRVAHGLGLACGCLVAKWRRVAEINLRKALPRLSPRERRRIRVGVFQNLGRVALALAKLPAWSEQEVRQRVDFVGLEHFRAGAARGRGVILLTAHLGNWELGALAHGAVEGPVHVIVRPIENPLVNRLVEGRRSAHGNRVISKRAVAREVFRVLRSNGTVGILADQNAVPEDAVFVDFFGTTAAASRGVARIALRSGAAVVPAVAWWDGASRRHVVEYGPRIELVRTGDPSRDLQASSQIFQTAIEERVRRHPEQWLWIHRRWKTRPPGESLS